MKILTFGIGFAIGALSGVGGTYLYFKKKMIDEVNAENERLENYYKELYGVSEEKPVEEKSDILPEQGTEDTDKKVNYTSYSKSGQELDPSIFKDRSSVREPKPREEKHISREDVDSDDEEDDILTKEDNDYIVAYNMSVQHGLDRNSQPKLIDYEDWGENGTLKQETLLYFVNSGTLTTEDEEEIDDPILLVGDCMNDIKNSESDSVFVRNQRLGYDYEVIKVYTDYSPKD